MLTQFLAIRLRQATRIISEIGLARTIFVLIGLILISPKIFSLGSEFNSALFLSVTQVFMVLSLQTTRRDKVFLQHLHINKYKLFVCENITMSIPILGILLWHKNFAMVGCAVAAIAAISALRTTIKISSGTFGGAALFPAKAFEWRSSFRLNGIFLILLIALATGFCSYDFVIPAAIVLLNFYSAGVQMQSEPRQFVELYELSPHRFLWAKTATHLLIFALIAFFLLALFAFIHIHLIYAALYLLTISLLIQMFVVFQKYAVYTPNESLQGNIIFVTLIIFGFLIPWLSPLPLLLLVRSYKKAVQNLKIYLDVEN